MWTDCGACKRALRIFWETCGEKGWQELFFPSKEGKMILTHLRSSILGQLRALNRKKKQSEARLKLRLNTVTKDLDVLCCRFMSAKNTQKKSIRCYFVFLKWEEGISKGEKTVWMLVFWSEIFAGSKEHESPVTHILLDHVHTNANNFQNASSCFFSLCCGLSSALKKALKMALERQQ